MKVSKEVQEGFYLADGRYLRSVLDLAKTLPYMDQGLFSHHANETKNDFAEWLEKSVGENELAEELKCAGSKEEFEMLLLRQIIKSMQ